jgi:curved DNA-binding protein CbpA
MKDPLDSQARAYEVLGVSQSATLAEINAAYARLAAQYPARRQELTTAWQRLRRPDTRLEEDFWYYVVGEGGTVEPSSAGAREQFPWDPVVPPLSLGLEATDLAQDRFLRDFGPLASHDVALSHLEHYDTEPATVLPIVFDK